jgi:hypothetical protein
MGKESYECSRRFPTNERSRSESTCVARRCCQALVPKKRLLRTGSGRRNQNERADSRRHELCSFFSPTHGGASLEFVRSGIGREKSDQFAAVVAGRR